MKAVVEIELIRLIIHNNDGKIAEAIKSRTGGLQPSAGPARRLPRGTGGARCQ